MIGELKQELMSQKNSIVMSKISNVANHGGLPSDQVSHHHQAKHHYQSQNQVEEEKWIAEKDRWLDQKPHQPVLGSGRMVTNLDGVSGFSAQ
jgi:hypothetical protein